MVRSEAKNLVQFPHTVCAVIVNPSALKQEHNSYPNLPLKDWL